MIIQVVDPGERILVLYRDQINGMIIYNHPVRTILLLDEEDGASSGRRTRTDETLLQGFIELFLKLG